MFEQILTQFTGKEFQREYKFHPERKWRFDFANIETKTAIEINGGVFSQGRHTRGAGYIADMEKINAAIEQGWVVLQYTPSQQNETGTFEQIKKVTMMRT